MKYEMCIDPCYDGAPIGPPLWLHFEASTHEVAARLMHEIGHRDLFYVLGLICVDTNEDISLEIEQTYKVKTHSRQEITDETSI